MLSSCTCWWPTATRRTAPWPSWTGWPRRIARVHLLDVHERGIGIGLFRGFQHAIDDLGADVLIEMDADFQHNPGDIPHFLQKIDEGYDVVVGSRFVDGSINEMPAYRKALSIGANQVVRSALGLKNVTEITTSYRGIHQRDIP